MNLSDKQIKKFQELFLKEFGKELSFEDARERAIRLVCLYQAVYPPEKIINQN